MTSSTNPTTNTSNTKGSNDSSLTIQKNKKENELIKMEEMMELNFRVHNDVAKSGKSINIKDWGGKRFRRKLKDKDEKGNNIYVDSYVDSHDPSKRVRDLPLIEKEREEVHNINRVLNEIHPDIRKLMKDDTRIAAYKASADTLLITLTTGMRILITQHCDRKKHYIVKLKREVLLDIIG